jgi:hypothetical protein
MGERGGIMGPKDARRVEAEVNTNTRSCARGMVAYMNI